jgi:pimeloyl-ACP methyl ester carboxylesterase
MKHLTMTHFLQRSTANLTIALVISATINLAGCSSMHDAVAASLTVSSVWGVGEMPVADLNALYTNAESQWMDISGMRLHYRDEGNPNGQAIVLVHGILSSLHTWEEWNKGLANNYRIISLDVPGFGLTGGPEDPNSYSEALLHASFQQFVEQLQLDDFIPVGNSLGGYISAHYAALNPSKVKKLILIDPAGAPQELPFILNFASWPVGQVSMPWWLTYFPLSLSLWA